MKTQISQIGILLLVLTVGVVGLFHSFAGSVSGAETYDYKTCCCTIIPLQDNTPIYGQTVHRQVQAMGNCAKICEEHYAGQGWVYSKEGYCPR
ncbi:hypothetical protein DRJ22_02395 [Candidatus Woesearchaeota archaeon]|nr:MAG: hypothetical protein B6U93_01610 [Candidatus Woesearchaeota archaeon ex4484_78]RLE46272.1 MAG: hypothetical protein DRJ22_02395 [Candidatus Woesearchaeota archaeon]